MRYEYKVERLSNMAQMDMQAALNHLAKDGWELVLTSRNIATDWVFRRECLVT